MKANLKTLGEKGKGLLGKGLSSGKDLIQSGFSVVKGALMKMDTTSPDFWPNIDKACNDGQYEMVVSVLESRLTSGEKLKPTDEAKIYLALGVCADAIESNYYPDDCYRKAINVCANSKDDSDLVYSVYCAMGSSPTYPLSEARKYAILALSSQDLIVKKKARVRLKEIDAQLSNVSDFVSAISETDRELIYLAKDEEGLRSFITNKFNERVTAFVATELPKGLKFVNEAFFAGGVSSPILQKYYRRHPMVATTYILDDQYDQIVLLQKIREFVKIVQCLGAQEVIITNLSSGNLEMETFSSMGLTADGLGDGGVQKKEQRSQTKIKQNQFVYKMEPAGGPFLPERNELLYYRDSQEELEGWKLERQRGRLEFEQEFSGMSHNALAAEDNKSAGVHIPVRGGMLGRVGLNKNKKIKGSDENALHLSVKVKYAPLSMWSKFKKK